MDTMKIKKHPRDTGMVELYTVDGRRSVNVWAIIHEDLFISRLSPGERERLDLGDELSVDLKITTGDQNGV